MGMRYPSDALASIHETMQALQDVGAIEKPAMRHFDDACLTNVNVGCPAHDEGK